MPPDFQHHFRFLGKKCRDRITGFEGVGASVCFDAYGCIQTCLTPAKGKDGKLSDSHWFDNNRIEAVSQKVIQPIPEFMSAPKAVDTRGGFDKPTR